ncbi:MAG: prepilin-type N-terminal cleavage/methylation domain-containing protein [Lachnospiraceae bacterium]|nr:prepilin-type N-terminal cleavage/methylation domain-containing protein [Lachnospiraceae bacterium]MDE6626580.1 prepilin-type N-terminal cleavage/methylation domain-containing protein [Lachnospiraceae bacterium]
MTKKKNAGFSMVEILISLAIFAMLMVPIVSGIISSLHMTTSSKELQYRNDFAENLIEHIKAVPINEITKEDYYYANGTSAGTLTTAFTENTVNATWDPTKEFSIKNCTLTGKTELGTKHTPYNYLVQISNNYYASKAADDVDFTDPNNLALGIVEDIDYTKVALIDGTILNYDKTAVTSFRTKKLQVLKEIDEERYNQQIQGDKVDSFVGDTASRLMTIEVSGDATAGYTVRCILDYMDHNTAILGDDNHIQYVPYAQAFTSKLPNIYLMYNPCVYNGDYSRNDYIAVDTSDLDDSDVNIFLVETAQTYSQNILDTDAALNGSLLTEKQKNQKLYNDAYSNSVGRDNVDIHMVAMLKSTASADKLKKIHVYHNIGDNEDADNNPKTNKKSTLDKFLYKAEDAVDTTLTAFKNKINAGVSGSEKRDIYGLYPSVTVEPLNAATEENRGLYEVKIWIKEESQGAIDPSVDQPILQGTKGGNET